MVKEAAIPIIARDTINMMGCTLAAHKMDEIPMERYPMQKTGLG